MFLSSFLLRSEIIMSLISQLYAIFGLLLLPIMMISILPSLGLEDKTLCMERERNALIQFKNDVVAYEGLLSSWGNGDDQKECCHWIGVSCDNRTGHVLSLDLSGSQLTLRGGKLSSSLMELRYLNYLDLSGNDFNLAEIPQFIGFLSELRYLDLSSSNFGGRFSSQGLKNLSLLEHLDLSENSFQQNDENLEWVSHLSSLTHLDLSALNLSQAYDWIDVISHLPKAEEIYMESCQIPSPNSFSLNSSANITKSLTFIDLTGNQVEGQIPTSFANMCSLQTLRLGKNGLNGLLRDSLEDLSGCIKDSLEELDLLGNELMGTLPNFTKFFPGLKRLYLSDNKLNGTIPSSILELAMLEELTLAWNSLAGFISESRFPHPNNIKYLDLSHNSLEGMISDSHLARFHNLQYLDLSNNNFVITVDTPNWTPPFQLDVMLLRSCNLGPKFPTWIRNQISYRQIDISNASIIDTVPSWFWNTSGVLTTYMNLSHNQLAGLFPPDRIGYFSIVGIIDLSSNQFQGPIQPFFARAGSLNLSNNKLNGTISFLCDMFNALMQVLDLSNNLLSGPLPDCWDIPYQSLIVVNLADNRFSGNIPISIGYLSSLESLTLRNNNLTGELPSSMKNCTKLEVLDLGGNELYGQVPDWIGNSLTSLVILSLRLNNFSQTLSSNLCRLAKLQLLDLSFNNISGSIPKCLNNLTALTQFDEYSTAVSYLPRKSFNLLDNWVSPNPLYDNNALLIWKGRELAFTTTLGFLKSIDLSSNHLSGNIPEGIMELIALVSLNVSRNELMGEIPSNIGQLQSLDSLDLSRNHIFGQIPSSLSNINRLSVLDLSNNNLSGRIPGGTQLESFSASDYEGNPGLCGFPLPVKCPGDTSEVAPSDDQGISDESQDTDDSFIDEGFYYAMGLGFAFGLGGVLASFLFNKSWRHAYFKFLSDITKMWFKGYTILNGASSDSWTTST